VSVRIRTRWPDGQAIEQLYPGETEGFRALHRDLDAHRRLGHNISRDASHTIYTVTDGRGVLVQESEVVRTEFYADADPRNGRE
jgi:hypothetical protein